MEIESLTLDLHLKRKQKKPETVAQRPRSQCNLGSPRSELGRGATWVAMRPGPGRGRDLGRGATAAWVGLS